MNSTGNFTSGWRKGESGQQIGGMMHMCRIMMKEFWRNGENETTTSTPKDSEMEILFGEWTKQVESDILMYINETRSIDTLDIALKLKISVKCAKYFVEKLIKEDKVNI